MITKFKDLQIKASTKAALEKIGIQNIDVVIIALSTDFEASLVASVICKDLGVPYIMVRANDATQKRILEAVGVDRIILPERETPFISK